MAEETKKKSWALTGVEIFGGFALAALGLKLGAKAGDKVADDINKAAPKMAEGLKAGWAWIVGLFPKKNATTPVQE